MLVLGIILNEFYLKIRPMECLQIAFRVLYVHHLQNCVCNAISLSSYLS